MEVTLYSMNPASNRRDSVTKITLPDCWEKAPDVLINGRRHYKKISPDSYIEASWCNVTDLATARQLWAQRSPI